MFIAVKSFSVFGFANRLEYFKYIDPLDGAQFVNRETGIILNPNGQVNKSSLLNPGSIVVSGSVSGLCRFNITESNGCVILKPTVPFAAGERVTLRFTANILKNNGKPIQPFSTTFNVSRQQFQNDQLLGLVNEISSSELDQMRNNRGNNDASDYPPITVSNNNNPAPGYILLSNLVFNTSIPNTNYLLILENNAAPVFAREMVYRIFDFNRQPSGIFTYYDQNKTKYYALNSSYELIDSFYTGNGYVTDLHELRVMPNGHAMLMSYDKQIVDMRPYITGGDSAALVTGLIIQEIDVNKNVLFQWRSWDHFQITDATHENLLGHEIDYVHGNAIEIDNDGNILISSRHLDEITKINRSTGDIIWRLGGKHNNFAFVNDNIGFSHQHGIRRLPNGNLIMFDNGNYHTPPFSRAVEYTVNDVNFTATKVWEYRNSPNIYGFAMGFAQRLSNGNTLISWGSTNPTLTEVRPDGSKALQMSFSTGVFTYRAFKYDWNLTSIIPDPNTNAKTFSLSQNYPNPFNPTTDISFDIPKGSFVKLIVYDAMGREVHTLANDYFAAGSYNISFDASNLTSGVYFYKITAGDFARTRKMILLK